MPGYSFSVPYNNDPETLRRVAMLQGTGGNSIAEVFLSGPEGVASSGRVSPSVKPAQFAATVSTIHSLGLRANLVLNSTCEGAEWYSRESQMAMCDYLRWAVEEQGVESVTVANPLYLGMVKKWVPEVELHTSVLADIDCLERAKVAVDAGADVITPATVLNRNLDVLEAIVKETGVRLKLMVNEGCLRKCPYRKFHFNAVSHVGTNAKRVGIDMSPQDLANQCQQVAYGLFFGSCNDLIERDPSLILKSEWIRPEDLRRYDEVCSYFKISGRTMPRRAVVRAVEAYMEESYSADLLDIMDSSLRTISLRKGASLDGKMLELLNFSDLVTNCSKRCWECGQCSEIAKKAVSFGNFTSIKAIDKLPSEAAD